MSIEDIKARVRDIPGTENLTMNVLLGRQVFGFNGLIAGVDMNATDNEIEDAIRATYDLAKYGRNPIEKSPTPLPAVNLTEPKTMTAPAPGSFAASLRAMLDEGRAGIEQAKADGLAKVSGAIGKMNEAKVATVKVASNMAQSIEDEAASVMSELGQISNDLGA